MRDWDMYLRSHIGHQVWAFAAVDYFYFLRRSNLFAPSPAEFVKRLLPSLVQSEAPIVERHRGLLALCTQLMGLDFERVLPFTTRLLADAGMSVAELDAVRFQYRNYGAQVLFDAAAAELPASELGPADGYRESGFVGHPKSIANESNSERGSTMTEHAGAAVVVITALPVETNAVRSRLSDVHLVEDSRLPGAFSGVIQGIRVGVAPTVRAGPTASAITALEAVRFWRPRWLLLVGIAGGFAGYADYKLGDVVVGTQIVDYEPGKVRPEGIERRYEVFQTSDILRELAQRAQQGSWKNGILVRNPTGKSVSDTAVHFGVFGSGAKVIADSAAGEDLSSIWPRMLAVEMEGAGLALAAHRAGGDIQIGLVKAVSDWADEEKDDSWQEYAADSAAAFAFAIVALIPIDAQAPRSEAATEPDVVYSGRLEIEVCRRLGKEWLELAVCLEVPHYDRDKFEGANACFDLLSYLKRRKRLRFLETALRDIGREDLADELQDYRLDR